MYSRARVFGHPIHPMIIPFPITALTLALVALIVFALGGGFFWLQASYWLAIFGVVAGLVAAIPGLIDWSTIPSDTAAKPVATTHMVLNVTLVALFFVSWLLLGGFAGPAIVAPLWLPLVLQIAGAALLMVSGWLGGELSYRHHVAVEPVGPEEERIVDLHERRRAA